MYHINLPIYAISTSSKKWISIAHITKKICPWKTWRIASSEGSLVGPGVHWGLSQWFFDRKIYYWNHGFLRWNLEASTCWRQCLIKCTNSWILQVCSSDSHDLSGCLPISSCVWPWHRFGDIMIYSKLKFEINALQRRKLQTFIDVKPFLFNFPRLI